MPLRERIKIRIPYLCPSFFENRTLFDFSQLKIEIVKRNGYFTELAKAVP